MKRRDFSLAVAAGSLGLMAHLPAQAQARAPKAGTMERALVVTDFLVASARKK